MKSLLHWGIPIPSLQGAGPGGCLGQNGLSDPHSYFIPFFFSCLSYFFLFFCLGILPTPAKKKKINNREKLRAVLADCSGRFVCSNPIVLGSCRLLLPAAPSWLLTLGWWGYIASIPVVAGRAKEQQKHPSPFPQLMFQSEHWAGAW